MPKKIKYSWNITTLNEAEDITKSLDAISKWKRDDFEVNIIDGNSKDGTVDVIKERKYKFPLLIIINKSKSDMNTDRNLGLDAARGKYVTVSTADNVPPEDFLDKMDKYFDQGFDVVLPSEATPINTDYWAGAWIYAEYFTEYGGKEGTDKVLWSEGATMKTSLARKIRFPYVGKNIAGEDAWFGRQIWNSGAKIAWAKDMGMKHIAPSSFREFWGQRKARSRATLFMQYHVYKVPLYSIIFQALFRMSTNLAMFFAQIPSLYLSLKYLQNAKEKKLKYFLWFYYAWQIDLLGRFIGKYKGIRDLLKVAKENNLTMFQPYLGPKHKWDLNDKKNIELQDLRK